MNNKLALLVAVVLGMLSIVGIQMYIQQIKTKEIRGQELIDIYTATRDISAGEPIQEADVDVKQMPVRFMAALKNSQIKDRKLIVGSTARVAVSAGQIFQEYHLYSLRSDGQKLQVEDKYRAVTIKVDAVSGIAGMVRPGDFVDVIGSFETDGLNLGGVKIPQLTSVILHKMKVLATDQQTDPNSANQSFVYRTVTLRVRPHEATKVVHAQMFGKIFLVMVKDSEPAESRFYPVTAEMLLKDVEPELKKK